MATVTTITPEEFVEFITGLFFDMTIANFDNGMTIADNVATTLQEE